jgi:hypothetical protein
VHAEAALQLNHVLSDFRLTLQNVRGGLPIRPFLLIVNGRNARPPIAFLADPDSPTAAASALTLSRPVLSSAAPAAAVRWCSTAGSIRSRSAG